MRGRFEGFAKREKDDGCVGGEEGVWEHVEAEEVGE